jgi:Xaa-Pro aminopeptidase
VATTPTLLERCLHERLTRVQARLSAKQADGILVSDRALLYWLGSPRSPLLLITHEGIVDLSPAQAGSRLGALGGARVGFDASLTASQLCSLQEAAPGVRWVPFAQELVSLRAVKDAVELALLRQAACITQQVFERIETSLAPGCSETDLLHQALEARLAGGGQAFSFDPSIASGPRTALLWADVSLRTIAPGEPVVVDLGVTFRGYRCDMTRSYLAGGASPSTPPNWGAAVTTVEEALVQVRAAARPGIRCGELHALCECVLERAGFGKAMQHNLGHGVGLELHEFPTIAPGSPDVLEAGMVIALEPGITLGKGGVRREDMFLVTEGGCESLTS